MRLQAQVGFLLFALITATITEAQTPAGQKPSAAISQAIPAPPTPQRAISLLDEPPVPAQVTFNNGNLTVNAENSSLSQILHDISSKTGMQVEGTPRDQRIFGNYGPASPREVLASLLDGLGYNTMLVGSLANGAPRQIVMTPRNGGIMASVNPPVSQMRQNPSNDEDDDSSNVPDQQENAPPRPEPPAEPAPEATQPPEQQSPQQPQVKTPQQLLQELQNLRQQQQQQQQNTPQ
ncbi:MAG TPA: hypothetical protein VHB45_07355 [Alloacidobacterium sp.]|nr:hypothetical protein [Alloacidobacterium sp.]